MAKNETTERHEAIKDLIKKMAISDQKELVHLLKKHYDIETNQAVISRDLRKLNALKKLNQGALVYEIPDTDITAELLKLALVDINHNETMIVINTQPGLAAFVGECVDKHDDLEVLGCLAGENVVFVIPKSVKEIHKSYLKICEKFHFKKGLKNV